jgi:hypothetical protein
MVKNRRGTRIPQRQLSYTNLFLKLRNGSKISGTVLFLAQSHGSFLLNISMHSMDGYQFYSEKNKSIIIF